MRAYKQDLGFDYRTLKDQTGWAFFKEGEVSKRTISNPHELSQVSGHHTAF